MISFEVNGTAYEHDGDIDMPLLWVLRDTLDLNGTKFGCGIGQCGACTVHINGIAKRSCITPVGTVAGQRITTIEGLSESGDHPVQRAWMDEDVAQCGYCQVGQIMAAADLLARIPEPTDDEINRYHTNLCRCGTYARIRRAIHRAAKYLNEEQ